MQDGRALEAKVVKFLSFPRSCVGTYPPDTTVSIYCFNDLAFVADVHRGKNYVPTQERGNDKKGKRVKGL